MPRTLAACLSHDADTQRACASARAAHTHAHGPASTARAPAADHTHTTAHARHAAVGFQLRIGAPFSSGSAVDLADDV